MKNLYLLVRFAVLLSIFGCIFSCQKTPDLIEPRALQDITSESDSLLQIITDSGSLIPIADASVFSGLPDSNRGSNRSLVVKSSPSANYDQIAYLRFVLGSAPITSAKLRLHGRSTADTEATITVYGVNEDWNETSITWNNQPTLGEAIGNLAVDSSDNYDIDVTSYVHGKTNVGFALKNDVTDDEFTSFSAREGRYPPELILTYDKETPPVDTVDTPTPDHVIFVWLENKGYPQIVGSSSAPYINSLIKKGTLFTNSYALTHPSYPNYVAFFSGSTQGVTNDECISGTPFYSENLYTELDAAGRTFAWYSEDLPSLGSTVCTSGDYVEKHNPVSVFANVDKSANKPFSAFPTDYSKLENVVCITPNLRNDMHDGSISQGDTWLEKNLADLADWCLTHNSIFVVYWDEDNRSYDNRIPVVALGEHVKANYKLSTKYDHYNWTKTICSMFGASTSWSNNIGSKNVITGCWK